MSSKFNIFYFLLESKKRIGFLLALFFMCIAFCFFSAKKINHKNWIDEMIFEVEVAWAEADKKFGTQDSRREAAVQAVGKYFYINMDEKELSFLLSDLESNGFDIREYHREGAKKWSDKDLIPYFDEEMKNNIKNKISHDEISIVAKKRYGWRLFVLPKYISISVVFNKSVGKVVSVNAVVWVNFI